MKYKNKEGIELAYEGHENDTAVQLVKNVIREAVKIGDSNNTVNAWPEVRKFLINNFSILEK
tara:strand:- start:287 stop:472 length:186 start_codon:yes stop_codon:yes gene_type:complete